MNIFRKYALRSMHKNRARTIITIIGMILSTALFTAVIEGAASGINYFREVTAWTDGNYHAAYQDITEDEAVSFLKNDEISDSITFNEVGWAESDLYPYIRIMSGDIDNQLVNINLSSGRYPKNNTEILLPDYFNYSLDEQITFVTGIPYINGKEASFITPYSYDDSDTNTLENTVSRTYTVVGYYNRIPAEVNQQNTTAYTTGDEGDGKCDVFFTVKDINKLTDVMKSADKQDNIRVHRDLVRFIKPSMKGVLGTNALQVVIGFAVVLIVLVVLGSITMIANSFSISVSERMKEYGMLKSIGASNRQIRSTVLTEALFCSIMGIIPGAALGFAGLAVVLHLVAARLSEAYNAGSNILIHIVFNWPALGIAVLICLLTALLAAWSPASKAVRVTPLEAIRQNNEMEVKPNKLRTGRLTWKLFGLEGAIADKNFKRNRRRFRSIIFSLSMSIILFISSTSFVNYLNKITASQKEDNPADITINGGTSNNHIDDITAYTKNIFDQTSAIAQSTEEMYYMTESVSGLTVPNGAVTSEFLKYDSGSSQGYSSGWTGVPAQEILFMDDDSFHQLLTDNNVSNPSGYFDAEHPKAVIYNKENNFDKGKSTILTFLNSGSFPVTASVTAHKNFDGEVYVRDCGEHYEYACYMPIGAENYDPVYDTEGTEVHKVSHSEAEMTKQLIIGAPVTNMNLYTPYLPELIYPVSAYNTLKDMGIVSNVYYNAQILLKTPDHEQAYKDIGTWLSSNDSNLFTVYDQAAEYEATRSILFTIRVFSFAFILLISIIAVTNIFNTISTNMQIRRKEYAMLRSVGMTSKSFKKMLTDECLNYGIRSLLIAIPLSILITYWLYVITNIRDSIAFYIPVSSILTAVIAVFLTIALSMAYGRRKLAKENLVEALRNETA